MLLSQAGSPGTFVVSEVGTAYGGKGVSPVLQDVAPVPPDGNLDVILVWFEDGAAGQEGDATAYEIFVAALVGARLAARRLSRPVADLRRAALAFGEGRGLLRAYRAIGYRGILCPDHVPASDLDPARERFFAFALGYTKGLLQAA